MYKLGIHQQHGMREQNLWLFLEIYAIATKSRMFAPKIMNFSRIFRHVTHLRKTSTDELLENILLIIH